MKLLLTTAVCALALMPVASLPAVAADASGVGLAVGAPGAQTGKDFVQYMMMTNKFEIAAGRLAVERARSPAIRDFAEDMIAAHIESGNDLKATSDGTLVGRTVTPPPSFDPEHQDLHNALTSSFGRRFEQIYISQQIQVHEQTLDYLQGYASNGRIDQLARFARHQIPVVQDQLDRLRSIDNRVASTDGYRDDRRDYRDRDYRSDYRDRNYPDRRY